MNAITRYFGRPRATQVATVSAGPVYAPDSLLNFVAMAVRDPATDVAKLETLLRMQREIVADDARLQFNRAMSLVQSEMQPVVRDAENSETKSKYARLETIDAVIRPIYSRHGFSLSFNEVPIERPGIKIACDVAHAGGHSAAYSLEAVLDVAGPKGTVNKTPLHGLGSAVSYLQRYLTRMIFNVVLRSEDNDGNWRGSAILLTPAQCEELNALMRETFTLESKFLAAMCPGLTAIEQAPGADFPRLRNALRTKREAMAKRAQTQTQGVAA